MLLMPSIDLRGGRVVRLLRGEFERETRYGLEPQTLAHQYRELGATWLHVVDLDGARDGRCAHGEIIATLAASGALALQVGGGIRAREQLADLFALGVRRAVIGSAAVEQPDQVAAWLSDYGPERLCLAFDVRLDGDGVPRLCTHGWRESSPLSLWQGLEGFVGTGLKHVLCTDIGRDGALAGPNLTLYREALRRFPQIRWQASGGIASAADLRALAGTGVPAAISGKALLEQRIDPKELRPYLPNA